ncbi:hypothetical protein D3C87_1543470 [compost metagenome]
MFAVAQLQHHRGAALRFVGHHKRAGFAQTQMHARAFNWIERHNAARQFSFETALVADILDKLAAAEHLFFVHQLVAFRRDRRNALRRQRHSRAREFVFRDQNLAVIGINAIGNRLGAQHFHHLRDRNVFLAAVQRHIALIAAPQGEDDRPDQQQTACGNQPLRFYPSGGKR